MALGPTEGQNQIHYNQKDDPSPHPMPQQRPKKGDLPPFKNVRNTSLVSPAGGEKALFAGGLAALEGADTTVFPREARHLQVLVAGP